MKTKIFLTAVIVLISLASLTSCSKILDKIIPATDIHKQFNLKVTYAAKDLLQATGICKVDYVDSASVDFLVLKADTEFIVKPGASIANVPGQITSFTNLSLCSVHAADNGDLLHIDSISVRFIANTTLRLTVFSTQTTPHITATCSGGSTADYPSIPGYALYGIPDVTISNNNPITITAPGGVAAETITFKITPQ